MKTLVISIAILLSIASCRNSTPNNNKIENVVSDAKFDSDTLFNFENEVEGKLPKGFFSTATGKAKNIKWSIVNDNGNKVVEQQAINEGSCFNLLIFDKNGYKDFTATVKIKAISGEIDQGGGLIWRYIDKDNYYIARYNPLENNFRFYRVVNGRRKQLVSVNSNIKQGEWCTMTIEMKGNKIICSLNAEKIIEASDDTFQSAGFIGFWTKADAVTYFDDMKINKDK
ncbi:MAG: family 16 glycoside hydrolase [Bacteroidota bacterium]|nr:family 16 glycoside hydrolase [Bacteroidota bacterium]